MAVSGTYITVELVARVSGDDVVLLDVNGKKIGVVPKHVASKASDVVIQQLEEHRAFSGTWRQSLMRMLAYHAQKRIRTNQTDWQRKIGVWLSSVRMRRNRPEHQKASHKRRSARWIEKRPSWDAAIHLMLTRNNAVIHKTKQRRGNPWRVWTETVVCNVKARRRRNDYASETEATDTFRFRTDVAPTGLQMRFNWHSIDTTNGMA